MLGIVCAALPRFRVDPTSHPKPPLVGAAPPDDERATNRVEHALDLELARRVLANDDGAFAHFVDRMGVLPRILDVLNTRLGKPLNDHDLADLAQDTLIVVWSKLASFAGEATLETWVFGVARLELMNAVRKIRRRVLGAQPLDAERLTAPVHEIEARLDYGVLHQALAKLDPLEADVIRLKHFDDLTFETIGARRRISANTAKTRYYRGIRHLQDELRAHF
jgi:RNA polymerase sigma-70 factor (ECF subfamily)